MCEGWIELLSVSAWLYAILPLHLGRQFTLWNHHSASYPLCFSAIGGKGRIPFYLCHPFLLVKVSGSERGYGSSKWSSFSFGTMQGCSGNITCASTLLFRCLHAQHTASHRPFACGHTRLSLWRPLACFLFLCSVSSGIFGPINWDFPPIKGHLPVCLYRGMVCCILPPRG